MLSEVFQQFLSFSADEENNVVNRSKTKYNFQKVIWSFNFPLNIVTGQIHTKYSCVNIIGYPCEISVHFSILLK